MNYFNKFITLLSLLSVIGINSISAQCTASFTYIDNGNGNYTFTNTSTTASGLEFDSWNFGDGDTSATTSPNHTFLVNGTYAICLTITDIITTCVDSSCQIITVTAAPPCSIIGFTSTDNGGGIYSFASSVSGGTAPYSYSWSFGDGNTSNATNPTNIYASGGTYYPSVTITDVFGCTNSYTGTILVNLCNYALTGVNYNGGTSQFQAPSLTGNHQIIWSFGDGIIDTVTNNSNWINHNYLNSGTYIYCLTVDSCPPICDSIIVDVCDFYIYYNNDTVNGIIETTFLSSSTGTNYFWDFGDGVTSTLQSPLHIYSNPGTYTYCLTVDSCPPVCDSVVIYDLCAYTINDTIYSGIPTDPINFYSSSYGSSYFWDFGDGVTSTLQSPQHIYTNSGTYYYCLTINSCPPVCDSIVVDFCNFSTSIFSVNSTTFNFGVSIDTSSSSVLWSFGDGVTSTLQYPLHTYTNSGTYYYCVTVDSCPPICDSVVVSNPCDSTIAGFTYLTNGNSAAYFNNTSTSSNGFTNFWDFGDGVTTGAPNPSHLYTAGGWYYISLTITDSAGCVNIYNDSIYINLCSFSLIDTTYTWSSWDNIEFFANAFGSNFYWDFGDGTNYTGTNGNASHTYTNPGTYYYCVTVDSCPPVCDSVIVAYQCQTYYVSYSPDSLTNNINFYSSGNNGTSYFWDFGDGVTSAQQYPQHIYANSGTYYYCLTIDSCPPVCDSIVIDYCNNAISVWGSYSNGYNFWTNSNSTNLLWDFGDGITSTQQFPLHYYALPGTYYYCLTVDSCPPVCDSITVIQYTNISGILYLDNNLNCVFDGGDVLQSNAGIELWQNGNVYQYAATNANGLYSFNVPTNQSYIIKVGSYINGQPWNPNVGCPTIGQYNIALTTAGSFNNDFGIIPTNNFDLTGTLTVGNPFPGALDWIDFDIYNLGTTVTNATVKLVLDPRCYFDTLLASFLSSIPPDTIIYEPTGDTLIWNSLTPSNFLWNYVYITYDTNIVAGDTLCFTLMEFPLIGDVNQNNNVQNLCVEAVASYDPNIKEVLPVGNGPTGLIQANQSMEYTIQFQNTGTAPANNVYILDVIDSDLDLNSLTILSASHNYTVQLLPGNQLKFRFDNIMLPDSGTNQLASRGFIKYTINQLPNLVPGTEIENTADIYFDFNPAIITNTTLNTIDFPTAVESFNETIENVLVYPNPVKNNLTIKLNLNEQAHVNVFITDILGNKVAQINNKELDSGANTLKWNSKNLSNGIYLLNIETNNSLQVKKLILN